MTRKYYCKIVFKHLKKANRNLEDEYYTDYLSDGKSWINEVCDIYEVELYYIIEVETDELVYNSEEDEIGF